MTLTITLSPETEKKLHERAAQAGQTVEGFVCQLVEREVHGSNGSQASHTTVPQTGRTFDEIFAPLRQEVAASGVTDDELDHLLEQARAEVWQERKAARDQSP